MFNELVLRDHEDGRATGKPQGVGPEAYLNGTSQGPTPEDARKGGQIRVAVSDSLNIRAIMRICTFVKELPLSNLAGIFRR